MHDVIIVGGGPVGSHVARGLAEKGHQVLVLEKKSRVGEKVCCTGIIGQECVNNFSIDDKVILRKVNSAALFSPSGNSLHLYRQEPQACVLDRSAFDIFMAERAQHSGAEYNFNSRVTGIITGNDHASVSVSCRGKEFKIPAKAVVIASGFSPGLNERLGLGTFKDFTTGAQAEVETPGIDEVEVYFGDMAPGFFAWLVPTAPSMARVGLLARKDAGLYLKKWLAQLAKRGKIASAEAKLSYGGIPLKPPTRTYGERMIAVGDAAGQVKPTSGGGIYYGLLSAEIAADTLHRALADDDLSSGRLARYERAWRRKLGRELRAGYWARKLFERLSDRQIDRIFEIIKAGGIDEALLKAEDLSFDWHSRTIIRLLKYQMVAKTLEVIKLPFRSSGIDR
jgi:digeranylgeranylglycerophospholipid reductase